MCKLHSPLLIIIYSMYRLLLEQYSQQQQQQQKERTWKGTGKWSSMDERNIQFLKRLLQKPSKSVRAYAETSINVQLGQCYDTPVIKVYAAFYSLLVQSTSTFIIMFDTHPLSRRSDVLKA